MVVWAVEGYDAADQCHTQGKLRALVPDEHRMTTVRGPISMYL